MKKKPAPAERLDLAEVRERLGKLKGKQYWRGLEQLAETDAFNDMLHREFPKHAAVWDDGVSRRNFLQLMGASLALAGLAGCTKQPPENIIPYVRQPEEIIPGHPLYFATAMPLGELTVPMLVRSDMGRPIKVEGNPEHPAGQRGTDLYSQASMLGMYDPDRSQTITELGELRTWGDFQEMMMAQLARQKQSGGAGIRILTGAFTSPTLAAEMQLVLRAFPQAKWHMYEPVNRDNARSGAQMAFGQIVEPIYKLENADVILSLDADFLNSATNPRFLKDAKAFASRKRAALKEKMNRLYQVESVMTQTGGNADNRLTVRSSDVEKIGRAIAAKIGVGGAGGGNLNGDQQKFVDAVAADLQQHRGASAVLAGETQPPAVHALAHAMNEALGNAGKTVEFSEPVLVTPPNFQNNIQSIRELADDINAGKVEMLVIWGVNPAYTAPDDLNFRHTDDQQHGGKYTRYSILSKVPMTIHLGLYQDETSQVCRWHVNEAHHLESWGDARTYDGTVTLLQPLIEPLYGGKTPYEVFGQFTDQPSMGAREWVHNYWNANHNTPDFETFWRKSVHDGFIANTANAPKTVAAKGAIPAAATSAQGMEIVFRPDTNIYDGRFANNAWLQELPRPITTITWDNAACISLNTAIKLGMDTTDAQENSMVELDVKGRKLEAVAWITPGMPDDSITIHLGYGRDQAGRTGNAHGWNAYLLRTSDAPNVASGVSITKLDKTHAVASVHTHHNVKHEELATVGQPAAQEEERGVLRAATLDEFQKNPHFADEKFESPARYFTLYKPDQHTYTPDSTSPSGPPLHKWGMAIDLNACIGCNTCVVACQSENNIPVVGPWEVRRGREMHWLRIDNYYIGDFANPDVYYAPVPCMQCENAPCEVVCPVGATVHSSEGLNDMVYNRCVGTRYCSNNCPYKVRRFNFMLYADYTTPQFKLMNNPDVTVRSRGVMEKCTYCVQRITHGRIQAEEAQVAGKGNGVVPDGAVQTACQQACPADAIVFGNMNDPNAEVNKWKAQPTNYGMLADLNTQPRTTYLAAVTNPNPQLKGGAEQG